MPVKVNTVILLYHIKSSKKAGKFGMKFFLTPIHVCGVS